jgi:hypothetical protein
LGDRNLGGSRVAAHCYDMAIRKAADADKGIVHRGMTVCANQYCDKTQYQWDSVPEMPQS